MIKNLVIVESPAKAKTIEKILGKDYKVMASYGHIRDLQKHKFSIDLDDGFNPIYEIPSDKKSVVNELRKAASEAETVWLASDEDREGEAIAWHLAQVLGLDEATTKRIVFHAITKDDILNAIANPRTIDMARVDAQQARRVLDRIVGFELSPVLWKKIKPALSAGRVQSVAVRLIVEREKEIKQFKSEPYYRVTAVFTTDAGAEVRAELANRLPNKEAALALLEAAKTAKFTAGKITVKPVKKSPAPPFTTSTLQQDAVRKLGFTVSQTMMVAQKLYEEGHITYMRTDSVNLSALAINTIAKEITTNFGEEYLHVRKYHTSSKGAQEAHEAIRPTYINKHTVPGTEREKKLYQLIWKRAVASQMADAELEKTTVDIAAPTIAEPFVAQGERIVHDGFLKLYIEGRDDESTEVPEGMLPQINSGDAMAVKTISANERYTLPPARYNEASLVKKMEDLEIGRPSTYAPTISTIQAREYVEKGERPGTPRELTTLTLSKGKIKEGVKVENTGAEKGKLVPTDIGMVVNDFLEEYFPEVVDYNFTAKVEERFDDIAQGNAPWSDEIAHFYDKFHPAIDHATNIQLEHRVGERLLGTDPATGKPVTVKIGRFGPMAQIGNGDDDDKPVFASLPKGASIATITLDEALKLFAFPRDMGELEGKKMTVAIGRFGPYVKWDKLFVSIPKDYSPAAITADEAVALIRAKQEANANKLIKAYDEEPDLQILNGRWGPYISYKKANYKLPKTIADPKALTLAECMEIIEQQPEKAPKKSAAKATAKKPAAKKPAAKKATATKKKPSTKK